MFEGYPLVVAEAFGHGRPVLTLSGGSTGSMVTRAEGWVVEPNRHALTAGLSTITGAEVERCSKGAKRRYERENNRDAAFASLVRVYQEVTSL